MTCLQASVKEDLQDFKTRMKTVLSIRKAKNDAPQSTPDVMTCMVMTSALNSHQDLLVRRPPPPVNVVQTTIKPQMRSVEFVKLLCITMSDVVQGDDGSSSAVCY